MILYGYDAEVIEWVGNQLECEFERTARAIGAVKNGKIIAGVVYHNYRPPYNIEMSIASISPKWATKRNLGHFFRYPFNQLGLPRVTAIVSAKAESVQKFLERLDFIKEGEMRNAHPDGNAFIYGLLREDCKYIEAPNGEEKLTKSTTGS